MFADVRTYEHKSVDADICIVGAGPAGITIAQSFIGTSIRVLLLESGGLSFERSAQKLAKGINAGLQYEALDLCRVRKFGGSTGKFGWGGWCKPLADIDFSDRPWIQMSGWPISRQDLQPYYYKALESLDIPSHDYDATLADDWARKNQILLSDLPISVEDSVLAPETGHSLSDAEDKLSSAENILVLLHATVTEIVSNPVTGKVTGVNIKSLSGRSLAVTARWIIVAAGGLENPRLLLQSRRVYERGIGNNNDLVGRCFMEHPRFSWGRLSGKDVANAVYNFNPGNIVRQRLSRSDSSKLVAGLGIIVRPEIQAEEKMLNARTWIFPAPALWEGTGGREIKELVFWLKKSRMPDALMRRTGTVLRDLPNAFNTAMCYLRPPRHWQFVTVSEQEPILKSRVTLDTRRDALGLNLVKLEWHLGSLVEKTLRRNQDIIVKSLSQLGFDCSIRVAGQPSDDVEVVRWVWHHMGTTRMSNDPSQGVVDQNCRVHGLENLYIAGSSIFPTGGNDMPTLTIVALAHRLADHLKEKIAHFNSPIIAVNDRDLQSSMIGCQP